ELGEPSAIAKPGLCARLMGPFNFISILLSEMPFEAVALASDCPVSLAPQLVAGWKLRAAAHGVCGPFLSVAMPQAAAAPRTVKLIGQAKAPEAARGGPTLLNGKEIAIGGTAKFPLIQSAPGIRIVGESTGGRLRWHRAQQRAPP